MRRSLLHELGERPLDLVRERCAQVSRRARSVRVVSERLDAYAAGLPCDEIAKSQPTLLPEVGGDEETLAAFVLSLGAINYGSGYFPHLRKRPGASGYRTIEAALCERFQSSGALSARELAVMEPETVARLLGQHPAREPVRELVQLYAASWRDLGALISQRHGGSFGAFVASAQGSGEALVLALLELPHYRDIARYGELDVPFLKRAQLSVADLAAALPLGLGRLRDLERLTIFADNLVPHVLRLDGVLELDAGLLARIEREELLPAGAAEEVELRAAAVHACELVVTRLRERAPTITAARLDCWLWARGAEPLYKARPRHRTRSTYY